MGPPLGRGVRAGGQGALSWLALTPWPPWATVSASSPGEHGWRFTWRYRCPGYVATFLPAQGPFFAIGAAELHGAPCSWSGTDGVLGGGGLFLAAQPL